MIVSIATMFNRDIILVFSALHVVVAEILKLNVYQFTYHPLVAIEVFFNESTYSVNENEGSVHPILVLSNPSSSDITVQVTSTAVTATGEPIKYNTSE